jgi:hypothetical protein
MHSSGWGVVAGMARRQMYGFFLARTRAHAYREV